MKQLTCEICGGTNLLKEDTSFVCQDCGAKYSVEQARTLLLDHNQSAEEQTSDNTTADSLQEEASITTTEENSSEVTENKPSTQKTSKIDAIKAKMPPFLKKRWVQGIIALATIAIVVIAVMPFGQFRALKAAQSYLEDEDNSYLYSPRSLTQQLKSDGYSTSEVRYVEGKIDWMEHVVEFANGVANRRDYISYIELNDQLKNQGFNDEEAKYGADNCSADWDRMAKICLLHNILAYSFPSEVYYVDYEEMYRCLIAEGFNVNGDLGVGPKITVPSSEEMSEIRVEIFGSGRHFG